jgi:hypothetical protein
VGARLEDCNQDGEQVCDASFLRVCDLGKQNLLPHLLRFDSGVKSSTQPRMELVPPLVKLVR